MDHTFSISGDGIVITPMTAPESELYRQLRNRPEVRERLYSHNEIGKEAQEAWFSRYLSKPGDYMFTVRSDSGTFLGACALYDEKDGCAEFGRIIIDKKAAGRGGVGCIALSLVCKLAKKEMGLHKITLDLYEDNAASYKMCSGAGFITTDRKPSEKEPGRTIIYMEKEL
ncbi:MAG: GNAT family N-acetyltransferase [Lachnospiraceae bacterium]|nr:GNAT family N-acetyltransferase [Lachnospiraceae bacterium]